MNDDSMAETTPHPKDTGSVIGSVASDIRTAATQKFDEAVTGVRAKADGAKTDVANDVKDVASALRRASEELRDGSAQERTLGTIASSLADASDSIREKDLGEIVEMVSKFGRANPILFLGSAALLGFAASRYAKASGGHTDTPAARSAAHREQVSDFVDEGNPNTQPVRALP